MITGTIGEWSQTGSGNCVSFLELFDGLVRAEIRWDESSSLDATKSVPWGDRDRVLARPNHGKPYWARINGQTVLNPGTSRRAQWDSALEAQEAVSGMLHSLLVGEAAGFSLIL